jgi:hypothetical protein
VEVSAAGEAAVPEWFAALEPRPPADVDEAQARAAVELCEAMTASEPPSEAVAALVAKARRELEAGRLGEAHWWAEVALNALGMTHETEP